MRFPLTPVQMMYLIGTRERSSPDAGYQGPASLLGVPCHAYVEFRAQHIDHGRLQEAWQSLLSLHPMLRASYSPDGYGSFHEEPYSDRIPMFDLSLLAEDRKVMELAAIRDRLESRTSRYERGQNLGLVLIVLDDLNAIVAFDLNLISVDVRSFHTVLRELHDLYAGTIEMDKLKDLPEEGYLELLSTRSAPARQEDVAYWRGYIQTIGTSAPDVDGELYSIDGEVLGQRRFRSLDFLLDDRDATSLRSRAATLHVSPYALMLFLVSRELCSWGGMQDVAALVPTFEVPVHPEATSIIGDFTDLGVVGIPLEGGPLEALRKVDLDLRQACPHSPRCTQVVLEELAARSIQPLFVFSAIPDEQLIGSPRFPALGYLSHYRSQTPQVALDVQVNEMGGGYLLHWVVPEGLFDPYDLEDHFKSFCQACQGNDIPGW